MLVCSGTAEGIGAIAAVLLSCKLEGLGYAPLLRIRQPTMAEQATRSTPHAPSSQKRPFFSPDNPLPNSPVPPTRKQLLSVLYSDKYGPLYDPNLLSMNSEEQPWPQTTSNFTSPPEGKEDYRERGATSALEAPQQHNDGDDDEEVLDPAMSPPAQHWDDAGSERSFDEFESFESIPHSSSFSVIRGDSEQNEEAVAGETKATADALHQGVMALLTQSGAAGGSGDRGSGNTSSQSQSAINPGLRSALEQGLWEGLKSGLSNLSGSTASQNSPRLTTENRTDRSTLNAGAKEKGDPKRSSSQSQRASGQHIPLVSDMDDFGFVSGGK